jgi:hypothetical protein
MRSRSRRNGFTGAIPFQRPVSNPEANDTVRNGSPQPIFNVALEIGEKGDVVPNRDFYEGLPLTETVKKLAEHHYEPENRHISKYEYEILVQAADLLGQRLPYRESA